MQNPTHNPSAPDSGPSLLTWRAVTRTTAAGHPYHWSRAATTLAIAATAARSRQHSQIHPRARAALATARASFSGLEVFELEAERQLQMRFSVSPAGHRRPPWTGELHAPGPTAFEQRGLRTVAARTTVFQPRQLKHPEEQGGAAQTLCLSVQLQSL